MAAYSNYGEFTNWRVENGYNLPSHRDCWNAATELAVKNLTAHNIPVTEIADRLERLVDTDLSDKEGTRSEIWACIRQLRNR